MGWRALSLNFAIRRSLRSVRFRASVRTLCVKISVAHLGVIRGRGKPEGTNDLSEEEEEEAEEEESPTSTSQLIGPAM